MALVNRDHTSPVAVRRFSASEWKLLRDLRLRALLDTPDAFGSTYETERDYTESRWMDTIETHAWFVAWVDGKPAGIAAGIASLDQVGEERDLVAMWIAPEHRGRRIAPQLIHAVSEWARQDGAETLALWVTDGNERARAVYEAYGFSYALRAPLERQPDIMADKYVLTLAP